MLSSIQLSKVIGLILVTFFERKIDLTIVSLNILIPKVVKFEFGDILISFKFKHSEKALSSINITESGISIEDK